MAQVIETKDVAKELAKKTGEDQNVVGILKELNTVLRTGKDFIIQAKQLQTNTQGNKQDTSHSQPAAVKSTDDPQTSGQTPPAVNRETSEPVVKYRQHYLKEERVKEFLLDVIERQAPRLPTDAQELKIADVIGENFKTFSYQMTLGDSTVTITHDQLIDTMSSELTKALNTLLEKQANANQQDNTQ